MESDDIEDQPIDKLDTMKNLDDPELTRLAAERYSQFKLGQLKP